MSVPGSLAVVQLAACVQSLRQARLLPQPKPAKERIRIPPQPRLGRQLLELPGIAASEDDVVRLECRNQSLNDIVDIALPPFPAVAFESGGSDEILEGLF